MARLVPTAGMLAGPVPAWHPRYTMGACVIVSRGAWSDIKLAMSSEESPGHATKMSLPQQLPLFPLAGTVLLPRCRLPLNIFEPRYLQMFEDAIAGNRLIGIVQPRDEAEVEVEDQEPEIEPIGCAGRIISFEETDDGRYQISLTGVCRFNVAREVETQKLYRMAEPDWEPFGTDLRPADEPLIDREELVSGLRAYFDAKGFEANWQVIDASESSALVNSLAMICPFDASDKQALLEAGDISERGRLVIALMNMAVLPSGGQTELLH